MTKSEVAAMAEYIERESLKNSLIEAETWAEEQRPGADCTKARDFLVLMLQVLNLAPAADVAPVRHGRWVSGCVCSVCDMAYGPENREVEPFYRYCPYCGAKTDKEAEDETAD